MYFGCFNYQQTIKPLNCGQIECQYLLTFPKYVQIPSYTNKLAVLKVQQLQGYCKGYIRDAANILPTTFSIKQIILKVNFTIQRKTLYRLEPSEST